MKSRIIVAFLIAVAGCWTSAVIHANLRSAPLNVEILKAGDWVSLESASLEGSDRLLPGYRLRVESARVVTAFDYLSYQGVSEEIIEGLGIGPAGDPDVVVVRVEVENESDTQSGGLSLVGLKILGESPSKVLDFDGMLFGAAHPELGGVSGFSVKPGTSVYVDVPFSLEQNVAYFEGYDNFYRQAIKGRSFGVLVVEFPHRVLVEVEAE